MQNRSILQSLVFSMEHKSFSCPQESCAEEVNSPVSLQQWLSFKLRGHYKNFKTGSTSIGRRVFYILKEKRILTQCTMYFPSLTVEIGKQLLYIQVYCMICSDSSFILAVQLFLHTTCIAPISAVSFSRIRSAVTDIFPGIKYQLWWPRRFYKHRG